MGLLKAVSAVARSAVSLSSPPSLVQSVVRPLLFSGSSFHSSAVFRDLSEFFEIEKFRGEKTIRVGREWRTDELRLKSNTDLHKLWYILLKERNMLLTMESAYKDKFAAMPNPERIDKVELSMENLEDVVRERNRAFWQLEVGKSGERERSYRKNCFGLMVPYKPRQHLMPLWMNTGYRKELNFRFQNSGRDDVKDFQARYRERLRLVENTKMLLQMRHVSRK